MKIKSLNIKNFKSIVDITINEPNPFTVFVGPNGSGKSNIFEALEYGNLEYYIDEELFKTIFSEVSNFKRPESDMSQIHFKYMNFETLVSTPMNTSDFAYTSHPDFRQFENNFSRIFVKNKEKQKINLSGESKLNFSAGNLEKVLKRLLENNEKKEEITDWLSLFIPEFDKIEIQKSPFSRNEDLLIYQKHYDRPFNKELISDGTYNIIAILTAVFQSDEPQFLCIEEPENGLHPFVIRKLVDFFRQVCEEKGHYIWLNTHSQTLVECLTSDEVIVVDKVEGETKVTQLKGTNLHGLDMAEYWLSGATGGGTPW